MFSQFFLNYLFYYVLFNLLNYLLTFYYYSSNKINGLLELM